MKHDHKFMLAHKWEEQDPSGWFMSEKLDGVRALWTGSEFVSRNGNKFFAPVSFTHAMPKCVLDGELYGGRGQFQSTVGIVKRHNPVDEAWAKLKFCIFEIPDLEVHFRTKIGTMQAICDEFKQAPIEVTKQQECYSISHLTTYLDELLRQGAEGLMLRQPNSFYEGKRSKALLKVKVFKNNIAKVIGHQAGMGKHEGRLGALLCSWNNKIFAVGTGFSDEEREHPPEIESLIRFSYFELTNDGNPRFPVYQGKVTL